MAEMETTIGRSCAFACMLPKFLEVFRGDIGGNLSRRQGSIRCRGFLKQEPCCGIKVRGVFVCAFQNLLRRWSISKMAHVLKEGTLVATGNQS